MSERKSNAKHCEHDHQEERWYDRHRLDRRSAGKRRRHSCYLQVADRGVRFGSPAGAPRVFEGWWEGVDSRYSGNFPLPADRDQLHHERHIGDQQRHGNGRNDRSQGNGGYRCERSRVSALQPPRSHADEQRVQGRVRSVVIDLADPWLDPPEFSGGAVDVDASHKRR